MARGQIVIIGAGFAGAATAWWLKRLGHGGVVILEQEPFPGAHASGKNAGIARQATHDLPTSTLCSLGASFLREPPAGFCETQLMEVTGGYLFEASGKPPATLGNLQRTALQAGAEAYVVDRATALSMAPAFDGAPFESALFCPKDGVVDIHALLTSYLRGQQIFTDTKVTGFERSGKRIKSVAMASGDMPAEAVVMAAGPWASELAALAGGFQLKLTPRRRHLFHSGAVPGLNPHTPYIWSLDPEVYVRPESGGWLMCPCDETVFPPGVPPMDEDAAHELAVRLKSALPALASARIARGWAALRTFSNDDGFVIGRDPIIENLFWVAALGGHGMTSSSAVGQLAASLILDTVPPVDPGPFSPSRFA